jgi:hypothetical protein
MLYEILENGTVIGCEITFERAKAYAASRKRKTMQNNYVVRYNDSILYVA